MYAWAGILVHGSVLLADKTYLRWRDTDGCGYSKLEHSSQAGQ